MALQKLSPQQKKINLTLLRHLENLRIYLLIYFHFGIIDRYIITSIIYRQCGGRNIANIGFFEVGIFGGACYVLPVHANFRFCLESIIGVGIKQIKNIYTRLAQFNFISAYTAVIFTAQ